MRIFVQCRLSPLLEPYRQELLKLKRVRVMAIQPILVYLASSKLATFALLVTLVLTGNDITPEQAVKVIGWMGGAPTHDFCSSASFYCIYC